MSNRIRRAGVSSDRRRIRLAAGWSRACSASKVRRPFSSMTSSPSTTNRSNGVSQQRRRDFGKKTAQGRSGFSSELDRAALLECEAAKAVPFRLELPLPGSSGSVSADLASIGAAEPHGRQIRGLDFSRPSGAHPVLSRKLPLSGRRRSPFARPIAAKAAREGVAQRMQGAQGSTARISTAPLPPAQGAGGERIVGARRSAEVLEQASAPEVLSSGQPRR